MDTTRWQPNRTVALPPWPEPPLNTSVARGLTNRCPACGQARLFKGFLTVVPACAACGAPLGLLRADDAPPYFVILITGQVVVPLLLLTQKLSDPPLWKLTALFVPLSLVLALGLLRPVKGAVVAAMLTMGLLRPQK
jgi:uncharacterized protein (DUF983 family)